MPATASYPFSILLRMFFHSRSYDHDADCCHADTPSIASNSIRLVYVQDFKTRLQFSEVTKNGVQHPVRVAYKELRM